jgi:hypothetical protein
MVIGGKTSDTGLVTSTALPNAFVMYINNSGVVRWKYELPAELYDSVEHISFYNLQQML